MDRPWYKAQIWKPCSQNLARTGQTHANPWRSQKWWKYHVIHGLTVLPSKTDRWAFHEVPQPNRAAWSAAYHKVPSNSPAVRCNLKLTWHSWGHHCQFTFHGNAPRVSACGQVLYWISDRFELTRLCHCHCLGVCECVQCSLTLHCGRLLLQLADDLRMRGGRE